MRKGYYRKRNKGSLKKILLQIVICIIIVIMVIGIKKSDMTMTNKFMSVIETGLQVEYNFKEIPMKTIAAVKKIPELPLKIASTFTQRDQTFAFSPPVDQGEVISTFGSSYDPLTEQENFQRGIDYYSPKTMDIYAIGEGTVTEVGNSNIYGDFIKVHHGEQIFSIYGGCSSIYAEKTQKVKKGDILASVDSSTEDPNYFHFELWVNGEIVNPDQYIDFD